MSLHPDSPWPERDDELKAHWASPLSATEIGMAMGLTKGQVLGRVHRLELPPRTILIGIRSASYTPRVPAIPRAPRVVLTVVEPAEPPSIFKPRVARRGCQWPMWGDWAMPKRDGATPQPPIFCDAPPRDADCPYCPAHHARAWRPRSRPGVAA